MTTRLTRTSTKSPRKIIVQVMCPSCRGVVRAQAVGHATVQGARREVLRCTVQDCELTWIPPRAAIPTAA